MKSATELYHVPLKAATFTFGEAGGEQITATFRPGLLSTVEDFERLYTNLPTKQIRATLKNMKDCPVKVTDLTKIRRYFTSILQIEWYQAKCSPVPQSVLETHNKAVQEVSVEEQNTSAPETSTSGEISTKPANSESKVRAGTRPYCRSLIEAGETNEQILLEAVHEKFPEKAAAFKVADVRGCLRNAGVIAWTKRKGSKKNDA